MSAPPLKAAIYNASSKALFLEVSISPSIRTALPVASTCLKVALLLANKELSVEKVKEEVKELIEAVENNTNKVHETADVLYHLIVYLEANNVKIEDVMKELDKRKK